MSANQDNLLNPHPIDTLTPSPNSIFMGTAQTSGVIGLGLDFGFAAPPFVRNMPEDPFIDQAKRKTPPNSVSYSGSFTSFSQQINTNATTNINSNFAVVLPNNAVPDRGFGDFQNDYQSVMDYLIDPVLLDMPKNVFIPNFTTFADAVTHGNLLSHSSDYGTLPQSLSTVRDAEEVELLDTTPGLPPDIKEVNPQTPDRRPALDELAHGFAPPRISKRRYSRPFDEPETPTKPRARPAQINTALANSLVSRVETHVSTGLTPLVAQLLFSPKLGNEPMLSLATSPVPKSLRTGIWKANIPAATRLYQLRSAKIQQVFTLFPALPPEIQVMIWHLAVLALSDYAVTLSCVRTYIRDISQSKKLTSELISPVDYQIPSLFHATSASRKIALRAFPPSFQSLASPTFGVHFHPERTILRVSLLSAQALAKCTTPSIAKPRNLTHIVSLIFEHNYHFTHFKSQADLLLRAPHCAWPAIKEWQFPGTGSEETIVWAIVTMKRPANLEEAEKRENRYAIAILIQEAVEKAMHEKGDIVPTNIGIVARYT